jgi:hypothetical protein
MRMTACICALMILLMPALALAQGLPEQLYKAEVIVTGKGEEERARGFREGLKEIFIKLTGAPAIACGDKLAPYLSEAGSFILEYTYEDRMKHLPLRDEQGTRDRPHYLHMTADAAKAGEAIKSLGFQIWRGRPEIDVFLTVQDPRLTFIAGAEGVKPTTFPALPISIASEHDEGYEQRDALKSIAIHRGLTLNLPDVTRLGNRFQNPSDLSGAGEVLFLLRLFGRDTDSREPARYQGVLTALPAGGWKLTASAWAYSLDLYYVEAPDCFAFEVIEPSFDTALKKSFDAFADWLRRDKDAPRCGHLTKF